MYIQDNGSKPASDTENGDSLPTANVTPPSRFAFSIVWVIPLVAALIGIWLAWKAISERGPVITLVFKSAEGLEPGKTPSNTATWKSARWWMLRSARTAPA